MLTGLTCLAVISLIISGITFIAIVLDILNGHKQSMWIMNIVWPVTALYAGPLALVTYWKIGRQRPNHKSPKKPFWQQVGVSTTHCGSGCTLGDLVAEWGLLIFPIPLFSQEVFTTWFFAYIMALIFGIAFQYFSIKPMSNLSPLKALKKAAKADVLSLTAWQIGMYGWMALVMFVIFDHSLEPTHPVFWFMMQIAMLIGFITSYPINWVLVKHGIKEAM